MTHRTYQVALPWPPSVNHYWRLRGAGGLCVAPAGVRFRALTSERVHALRALRRLPALPILGRLALVVDASAPTKARCDLDNLVKATQDALVHARLMEDDSQIDDLRVLRDEPIKGGRLLVTITELEAMRRRAA